MLRRTVALSQPIRDAKIVTAQFSSDVFIAGERRLSGPFSNRPV
jgi:hypothetical protein